MERLPCILTIAGSDSGGGAGIQADLKAITMLGGYGASVITALTAQNTAAVTGIHAPSAKFVALQLKTVLDDIRVDAAKTGMLFSAPIIESVAAVLKDKDFPLVVDPVCVATSGAKLLQEDAVEAMRERMFPLADLLTPNLPEAELFTGMEIRTRDDVFTAAKLLLKMGPKAVLIKGGHNDSPAITDWFVTSGGEPIPFMQQRVETDCTHGTGCTLSAAIATGLGRGLEMGQAVLRAQEYLNLALRAGYRLGEGGGPPNHLAPWIKERARASVLASVDDLGRRLVGAAGLRAMLPRGRANVAVAVPFADRQEDVAGFSGGFITTAGDHVDVVGYPQFGGCPRTASLLLGVRRVLPDVGCAMTLGAEEALLRVLDDLGVEIAWMDRENAPAYVSGGSGAFEEWGAFTVLSSLQDASSVRALGDPGGFGHEPVVYLLAGDVHELLVELRKLTAKMTKSPGEI